MLSESDIDQVITLHNLTCNVVSMFCPIVEQWKTEFTSRREANKTLSKCSKQLLKAENHLGKLLLLSSIRPLEVGSYAKALYWVRSVALHELGLATGYAACLVDEKVDEVGICSPEAEALAMARAGEILESRWNRIRLEPAGHLESMRLSVAPFEFARNLLNSGDASAEPEIADVLVAAKNWLQRRTKDDGPTADQHRFLGYLIDCGGAALPKNINAALGKDWSDERRSCRLLVDGINNRLKACNECWYILPEDRGEVVIAKLT